MGCQKHLIRPFPHQFEVYLREQKDEVITQLMSRNTIINKKEQNSCQKLYPKVEKINGQNTLIVAVVVDPAVVVVYFSIIDIWQLPTFAVVAAEQKFHDNFPSSMFGRNLLIFISFFFVDCIQFFYLEWTGSFW